MQDIQSQGIPYNHVYMYNVILWIDIPDTDLQVIYSHKF